MRLSLFVFLPLIALTACKNSQIYDDATVLSLDGYSWFVRETNDPGIWMAGPDKGWEKKVFKVEPRFYARNIKAIEQVSGCRYEPGSAVNNNGYTLAAVQCD